MGDSGIERKLPLSIGGDGVGRTKISRTSNPERGQNTECKRDLIAYPLNFHCIPPGVCDGVGWYTQSGLRNSPRRGDTKNQLGYLGLLVYGENLSLHFL